MPIHIAIVRRVRPGREAEFQQALRAFFQTSYSHGGVLGASLLMPPPGSDSREFGILRTFTSREESEAFYASELYREWEERSRALTEGEHVHRELTGLEAFFHAPGNPPRWKLAVATLLGVFPTSLLLGQTVGPGTASLPLLVRTLIFAGTMVALLTWVVMPLVTRVLHGWLHPKP